MLPSFNTIMYCTQMGPNAAYAFQYAYALAEKLSARIVVLHVVETLRACFETPFCCDRLRAPGAALAGSKRPRRRPGYASGRFAPAALPAQLSLGLATNGVSKQALSPHQEALVKGHVHQHPVAEEDVAERLRKWVAAMCSKAADGVDWPRVVHRVIVVQGDVPEQILRHIPEVGADVVVMGAHEKSLLDPLVGNTAREVAKRSPVPVLLV